MCAAKQVSHTEEEWKQLLSPASYRVLRQADTERSFSSPLYQVRRCLATQPYMSKEITAVKRRLMSAVPRHGMSALLDAGSP